MITRRGFIKRLVGGFAGAMLCPLVLRGKRRAQKLKKPGRKIILYSTPSESPNLFYQQYMIGTVTNCRVDKHRGIIATMKLNDRDMEIMGGGWDAKKDTLSFSTRQYLEFNL